jgi:hypothetical protein
MMPSSVLCMRQRSAGVMPIRLPRRRQGSALHRPTPALRGLVRRPCDFHSQPSACRHSAWRAASPAQARVEDRPWRSEKRDCAVRLERPPVALTQDSLRCMVHGEIGFPRRHAFNCCSKSGPGVLQRGSRLLEKVSRHGVQSGTPSKRMFSMSKVCRLMSPGRKSFKESPAFAGKALKSKRCTGETDGP